MLMLEKSRQMAMADEFPALIMRNLLSSVSQKQIIFFF